MRNPRTLPVVLVIIIGALIMVGLFYTQMMKNKPGGVTEPAAAPPAAQTSPVSAASPAPAGSPNAAASPQGEAPKSAVVDLTPDAAGLSKTTVSMTTTKGVIKFKFYPKDAPNTVNRIVELIQKGFYNGLTFHRVVPGFVIQGGDPSGNGTGGSGQNLKAEFNSRHHIEGTVAMARAADPDSADSQFYISLGVHPHLDNNYTIFGQVIEGIDVARKIQVGDKMTTVVLE